MATKTFATLRAEIIVLQAQADAALKREIGDVVANIKNSIAMYGLSPDDLGFRGVAVFGVSKKTKGVKAAKVSVPKYLDPKSGKTWTGHGKPPNWISGVKDRSSFLAEKSGEESSNSSFASTSTDTLATPASPELSKGPAPSKTAAKTSAKPPVSQKRK